MVMENCFSVTYNGIYHYIEYVKPEKKWILYGELAQEEFQSVINALEAHLNEDPNSKENTP